MSEATALLITADSALAETIAKLIDAIPNLRLHQVATFAEACLCLQGPGAALVLAHLPRDGDVADIAQVLKASVSARRPMATVVLSDEHRPEQRLALILHGVADCLDRPLDLQRVGYLIDVLTVRARYRAPEPSRAREMPEIAVFGERNPFLYVRSGPVGQLMELVQRVAPQETTVLLGGETGTGKTHMARLIHELSPRNAEPFVVVNCAALPSNLMESEMFGHVKGAFTGAGHDRSGKFTAAGRGTLLLDEIDALPRELQAKLLRAVEERTFEPLGSNCSHKMQARLVVASNRDLAAETAAGRFRSDLYYRLNVVSFYLPPLRERRNVIRPLVNRLLGEFAARNGRSVSGITEEALAALEGCDWPGNIRELRNAVERAVALCPRTQVQLEDLPEAVRSAERQVPSAHCSLGTSHSALARPHSALPISLARTNEEAEAARITEALRRHDNNRLRAAAELGISRVTLYKKLHRYGLLRIGMVVA